MQKKNKINKGYLGKKELIDMLIFKVQTLTDKL